MPLTKVKNIPSENLLDYTILLYGERKIGKTSLCSRFDRSIFFDAEEGTTALPVFAEPIPSWKTFLIKSKELKGDKDYGTVICDTADVLYNLCLEYVCRENNIEHPGGQKDYGASWTKVRQEFMRGYSRVKDSNKGVVFVSHAKLVEDTTRDGVPYGRIRPTLTGQAFDALASAVHIIAYYGYLGGERRLFIDGSDKIECGCRLENHFRTQKGERIKSIPMGDSSQEAYDNLMKAFRNELTEVGDVFIPFKKTKKRQHE